MPGSATTTIQRYLAYSRSLLTDWGHFNSLRILLLAFEAIVSAAIIMRVNCEL